MIISELSKTAKSKEIEILGEIICDFEAFNEHFQLKMDILEEVIPDAWEQDSPVRLQSSPQIIPANAESKRTREKAKNIDATWEPIKQSVRSKKSELKLTLKKVGLKKKKNSKIRYLC